MRSTAPLRCQRKNTFGDLGAAVRASHRKLEEARATWANARITTVWVVRDTAANRVLLARSPHILDATFTGSSRRWHDALTDGRVSPPAAPGLLWFDAAAGRLTERRRARMAP